MTDDRATIAIDLNADLGEGVGNDAGLYPFISSASIACGGHAGDASSMAAALRACRAHGVVAGAHPGFPDRAHFGRRRMEMAPEAVADSVCEQIAALHAVARTEGEPLAYVKLHGALANMAAEDDGLARTLFSAIARRFPGLAVLALENSGQDRAARALGLTVVPEAYADRGYGADGMLLARDMPGALIEADAAVVARCIRIAQSGEIVASDGTVLVSHARSICLHGDTPGALRMVAAIHAALLRIGHIVSPLRGADR